MLFSEPKIPQSLQRSIWLYAAKWFQCSSASRKFLNTIKRSTGMDGIACFSALQRAENSSIGRRTRARRRARVVSVLFSEPKIPQWSGPPVSGRNRSMFQCSSASRKFLNRATTSPAPSPRGGFQCSSASRKFLNRAIQISSRPTRIAFQCSSASRKFLNDCDAPGGRRRLLFQCSSASRKFLNRVRGWLLLYDDLAFQCSSASRKFLN